MKAAAALLALSGALWAGEGRVCYLVLDAASGKTIEADWPDAGRPAPMGSLVKPFTAVAYAQRHGLRYPVYECRGENCWLKSGHGALGVKLAIAHSCNAYFRSLAEDLAPAGVAEVAERFGLSGPAWDCPREALYGFGSAWMISPLRMARAYAELAARQREPGVAEVLEGMALSARIGTAQALGAGVLAKTGTAPCAHSPRLPGDGYVVALYPAAAPRRVLLVEVEGVVGREAAGTAARLLRRMR